MHVLTNIYYRVFDRGLCAIDVAISLSIKFWNLLGSTDQVLAMRILLYEISVSSLKKSFQIKYMN